MHVPFESEVLNVKLAVYKSWDPADYGECVALGIFQLTGLNVGTRIGGTRRSERAAASWTDEHLDEVRFQANPPAGEFPEPLWCRISRWFRSEYPCGRL